MVAAKAETPAASGQAAPAVAQGAPKGKFSYAFHTAIPPAWLDPQENPPQVTPYNFAYALHDALVKPMPGKDFVPSLAESYEIAPTSSRRRSNCARASSSTTARRPPRRTSSSPTSSIGERAPAS